MKNPESVDIVELGWVSGAYGVKGWVKLVSQTSQPGNIATYAPWLLGQDGCWTEYELLNCRAHGKGLIAQLQGVNDREHAQSLKGYSIAIPRDRLPSAAEGEYYWLDLEGLKVETVDGVDLGRVDHLFETGSNDVMMVKGERDRLLPFIRGQVVKTVDLQQGLMVVDWDPDF